MPWQRSELRRDTALTKALGLASLAIGCAELFAPGAVKKLLGLDKEKGHEGTLRVLGVREVMHGVGILADGTPKLLATGAWARVAGDALDSAVLAGAARRTRQPTLFAATTAAVMVIGALDLICALRMTRHSSCVHRRS